MAGRLGALAVLVAMAAAPAPGAQAPGRERLLVLAAQDQMVILQEAEARDGRIGRLTLLVRNESPRAVRLRVRFIPNGGDEPLRLTRLTEAPFAADMPTLFTNRAKLADGQLAVPGRHTTLVPLRFGVAEDAKASVVDGTLVFAAQADPRVQSAVIRTTGLLPTVVEEPGLTAQPQKLTIAVRRWLPAGLREGWRLVEEPRVWVPNERSDALVLLSSSSGDSMKARLAEPKDDPPVPEGVVEQELVVADLGAVGTYAGQLTLKPGDTDKIAVEAKVRDIIFWPFVVVGIGALIGGYGATRFQRWRTRRLLLAELGRVRRDYETRKDGSPVGPPPAAASPDTLGALQGEISDAKSAEELDELTGRVRAARDAIRTWRAIDAAARALIEVMDVPPDADVVETDTQAALDATKWIPVDVAAAGRLAAALRRQERIMRAFTAAYARWPAEAIRRYREHIGAFGEDAKTAVLIGSLERVPEQPEFILRMPDEEQRLAIAAYLMDVRDADTALANHTLDVLRLEPVRQVTRVELTPEQLERPVRRWDRTIAMATFLLTVLVFVFGVYDDDFGTWDDYTKALAAGLLGQVGGATVWNLFPGLRSYRLPIAKAAG